MRTHQKTLDSQDVQERSGDTEKQEEAKSGESTDNKRHKKRTVVSSRRNKRDESRRSAVLSFCSDKNTMKQVKKKKRDDRALKRGNFEIQKRAIKYNDAYLMGMTATITKPRRSPPNK